MAKQLKRPKPRNARELALETLMRIQVDQAYSNLALDQVLSGFPLAKDEKRLATAMVYGTLDYQFLFDEYIKEYSKTPIKKMDVLVLMVIRLGLWQIYFSRIPSRAAVHESVELVKYYGFASAHGFVNGILRKIIRQHERLTPRSLESKTGFQGDLLKHFRKQLGNDAEVIQLSEAFRTHHGMSLRVRDASMDLSITEVQVEEGLFQEHALRLIGLGTSVRNLEIWQNGQVVVQGESAMLPAQMLDIQAEQNVLDLCAAPGGKTIQMADLAPRATIYAGDIYEHRIELIKHELERLHVENVQLRVHDATIPWPEPIKFDKILIDAPCSALGLLGSKAELRYRWRANENLQNLIALQAKILEQGVVTLAPGGELVYSTCTLNTQENEEQIFKILEEHPEMKLVSLGDRIENLVPKLFELDEGLIAEAKRGYITLWPHKIKSEGFFIALLRKDM